MKSFENYLLCALKNRWYLKVKETLKLYSKSKYYILKGNKNIKWEKNIAVNKISRFDTFHLKFKLGKEPKILL